MAQYKEGEFEMINPHLIIIIAIFCVVDISLTIYTAMQYKKNNAWHRSLELGLLPGVIINKNPAYWKIIVLLPIQFSLYYGAIYMLGYFGQDVMLAAGMILGAQFIIIYIHFHNVYYLFKRRNDAAYWESFRQNLPEER